MNGSTNVSPPRPLVPPKPKPEKDKIGVSGPCSGISKLSSGTQVDFVLRSPENRTFQNGQPKSEFPSPTAPKIPPHSHPFSSAETQEYKNHQKSSTGSKLPSLQKPPISPGKPALPPKPPSNAVTSPGPQPPFQKPFTSPTRTPSTADAALISPPKKSAQHYPRGGNSVSIANAILANKARNTLPSEQPLSNFNAQKHHHHESSITDGGFFSDPESSTKSQPAPVVLRRDISGSNIRFPFNNNPRSPSEPLSPRPHTFNNTPRPFSAFNFPIIPIPEVKNAQPNFHPQTIISNKRPTSLSEIKFKSASLGRSAIPPTSPTSGGFFSNKANTLSRLLPLDLFTSKPKSQPHPPPQPLMQNRGSHVATQIQNFGRKISFSTDNNSTTPPPPPPRLRRKLSPVNSLSPTTESPSPGSPPAVFSPLMTAVQEEPGVIYAEIDKERKWADRKLKREFINVTQSQETLQYPEETFLKYTPIFYKSEPNNGPCLDPEPLAPEGLLSAPQDIHTASLVIQIGNTNGRTEQTVNILQTPTIQPTSVVSKAKSEISSHNKPPQTVSNPDKSSSNNANNVKTDESAVVDSWLGKYRSNPVNPGSDSYDVKNNNQTHIPITNVIEDRVVSSGVNRKPVLSFISLTESSTPEHKDKPEQITNKSSEKTFSIKDDKNVLVENESFLFKLCHRTLPENTMGSAQQIISTENESKIHTQSSYNKNADSSISLTDSATITNNNAVELELISLTKNNANKSATEDQLDHPQKILAFARNADDTRGLSSNDQGQSSVAISNKETDEVSCRTESEKIMESSLAQNKYHEKRKGDNRNDSHYNKSPSSLADGGSEITDPDSILLSVDAKIQSAVSRLSNLSGKSSPPPPQLKGKRLELTISEDYEFLSVSEADLTSKKSSLDSASAGSLLSNTIPAASSDTALESPTLTNFEPLEGLKSPGLSEELHIRRRSWNCSAESSSPCDSSCSSAANLRERAFTYSDHGRVGWPDEDDLSTGVLADGESSDPHLPFSSTEDMGASGSGFSSRPRKRWFFSSFGKGGSSSSSSNNANARNYRTFPKSRKDKNKALSAGNRPISEMLKSMNISGPMSPQILTAMDRSPQQTPKSSHPTVQFSPDVVDTPSYRYRYSASSISEAGDVTAERDPDCESMSSGCSVNTLGVAVPLYEDILAELSPQDKKIFYVAREILTSEQTFINVLDLLTVAFPRAIKEAEDSHHQPIIPPHEIDGILAGLPNLKRVNQELKVDLEERIKNWRETPKLSDIIVKKGPFLKLYAHYIKNFEKTTQHLDGCCQRYPDFAKALEDFERSNQCQMMGLKHYMLKPVQRMPQYRLLLEDYLKHLGEGSGDFEDTVKAIAIVRDVAEHANEAIKLQVNAEKLMHLQNRLAGSIIMKADRQLLKEGELMKVCRKELQPRFFALMNDCLMCMWYNAGTGGSKDLKLRYDLPLAGMRVDLTASEDYPNEFSVISVSRSFNLVAKSSREREAWMKALTDAIHDNIKKRTCTTPDNEIGFQHGKIAPVWIQDSRVTMCQICTAEFTVTFRRHHCRCCGKVVCGHCSGNQAPLQYLKNDAARVCDECYQYLLEDFDKESRENTSDGLETSRDIIRTRFKKVTPNVSKRATKVRRTVPARLELHANNSGSRISGYLHCRERKAWKKRWFVLMDRVLYIYAASEDIVAIKSIPVLGWEVDYEKNECMDGGDSEAVFKLIHTGQKTLYFQTDKPSVAEKWVEAMKEATVF